MSETETPEPIVRHFRQVLLWPLQLMPLSDNGQVHRHAEMLETWGGDNPWREVKAHGSARDCEGELLDTARSRERHYREFVTFLPHAQRFLYGQGRSSASLRGYGESPIRLFRRSDITHARLTFDDGTPWTFVVEHMDLYFYHDVDVVMLAFEFHTDEIPLRRVQELLFRFGRTYPAQWDDAGIPDQCMRNVEWLDRSGEVLASSDFMEQQVFHRHVSEHREARIGRHWEFLLRPMLQHHSEHAGEIRYRQLEYHRLPKLTYLALDNPFALSREDFFRLGMATPPDDGGGLLYPEKSLEHFEREHCYDNFWVPARSDMRASTRIMGTARSMVMVGSARNAFYADRDTGMLGQFRHQYFLLCMIAHFHRAALLMLSDRMVLAVSRLDVDDPESSERFRRNMRHTTEIFLRFNHRYWFHEVSKQSLAKDLYRLCSRELENDALFHEVRDEVLDMVQYLDSDASRRQNDTVLRLTVVTILGLIGTIATGFLGMNLIDEAAQPFHVKALYFLAVMVPSVTLTFVTVQKSGPLSEFLDAMSNERLSMKAKLERFLRVFRSAPRAESMLMRRREPSLSATRTPPVNGRSRAARAP